MTTRKHWEQIYTSKSRTEVSWYAPHLDVSVRLIRDAVGTNARILDVGAGASTLADDLLGAGYQYITLLDIADSALKHTRTRLGDGHPELRYLVADITEVQLPEQAFDVWHDRAVFHFLTQATDRERYLQQVHRALAPGGRVVLGSFAKDGPTRCSGLEVVRYDASTVAELFGPSFELELEERVHHTTPGGAPQSFMFCRLRKLT